MEVKKHQPFFLWQCEKQAMARRTG